MFAIIGRKDACARAIGDGASCHCAGGVREIQSGGVIVSSIADEATGKYAVACIPIEIKAFPVSAVGLFSPKSGSCGFDDKPSIQKDACALGKFQDAAVGNR